MRQMEELDSGVSSAGFRKGRGGGGKIFEKRRDYVFGGS